MDTTLRFHNHIPSIVHSASVTGKLIHKTFRYNNPKFLAQLFKTFVRPKLEYACQVWNTKFTNDIDLIEQVQRRYTKRIHGMEYKTYKERLSILDLVPLELRRMQLDLIYTYKILNGYTCHDMMDFFQLKKSFITRGHKLTLYPQYAKRRVRTDFFSHRIVNVWNSLPTEVALVSQLTSF